MDRLLRRRKERSGRLACLAVGAAHTLDNEAPRRVRIGGIAPRRRFQHRDEAFRDREIGFALKDYLTRDPTAGRDRLS